MSNPEKKRPEYPIIMLNHSLARRALLEKKLKEYERGLNPKKNWLENLILYADNSYKKALLERLLRDQRLDADAVRIELERIARDYFDPETFENALGVVDDYNRTGGKHTKFGTGITGERREPRRDIPNSSVNCEHTIVHPVYREQRPS